MPFDEIARWLGVIGGLTGPLGLVFVWLTYRRDAPQLRVHLQRNYTITGGPERDAIIRSELALCRELNQDPSPGLYLSDPDATWSVLEITNTGRRKVTIDTIGFIDGPRKTWMPSTFMVAGMLPVEIEEGKRKDFPVHEDHTSNAICAWARESTGRVWYGSFKWSSAYAWFIRVRSWANRRR